MLDMKTLKVGDKIRRIAEGSSLVKVGEVVNVVETKHGHLTTDTILGLGRPHAWELVKSEEANTLELVAILAQIEKLTEQARELVASSSTTLAQVSKEAAQDVEELTSTLDNGEDKEDGNFRYRHYRNQVEFHVNKKKGVVTALLKGAVFNKVHEIGIAKCNPADTFDESIGKAIAMRRALGLDVPKKYVTLGGK